MTRKLSTHLAAESNPSVYLTETGLALRWNVSVKKLQADRFYGRGVRYLKFAHAVRYALSDIVAFEASHTVGGTSEVRDV